VIRLAARLRAKPFHRTLAELGGTDVGDSDHMVTETVAACTATGAR
jgi:hypothetical protein